MTTLVLPILLFAAVTGLFVRRVTLRVWCVMALWIALVIARYYIKH